MKRVRREKKWVTLDRARRAIESVLAELDACAESAPEAIHDEALGPRLRPHGKNGELGWQVWTNETCVAILSHADVSALLTDATERNSGGKFRRAWRF